MYLEFLGKIQTYKQRSKNPIILLNRFSLTSGLNLVPNT